jgi:transcriptional regulator with XRE-family HTH domain
MTSGSNGAAAGLAQRLRELREREWDDRTVTQAQLAAALGAGTATVSSYENPEKPKKPPSARLVAYAQFFATRRSVDEKPPGLREIESFTPDERARFERLKEELLDLHGAINKDDVTAETKRRELLQFAGPEIKTGTVTIVCPETPPAARGVLADQDNLNHTRLHGFADADALLEVFGHIRALNPGFKVFHRLPSEIQQSDLQDHIVLLGGVGWNSTVRRIFDLDEKLPIRQLDDKQAPEGDVFQIKKGDDRIEETHLPVFRPDGRGGSELVEDVGLIARLPNPFNFGRTMTIFNGIYSKGVHGAALAVTDETVRNTNEQYLGEHFPTGGFAMLVRVHVWFKKPIAADLQNPRSRLFEWSADE